jgi:hypothetical protein
MMVVRDFEPTSRRILGTDRRVCFPSPVFNWHRLQFGRSIQTVGTWYLPFTPASTVSRSYLSGAPFSRKIACSLTGERPIGSTRDMRTWYTTRITEPTQRCQVSHIVVDSGWEKYAANVVEAHPKVAAWVKNDHLGFHILYLWNGSKRKYIPDFLVRYESGKTLVLEIKGVDSPQDQAKRAALAQWAAAVNAHGGFGTWAWDVVVGDAAGMQDAVERHAN